MGYVHVFRDVRGQKLNTVNSHDNKVIEIGVLKGSLQCVSKKGNPYSKAHCSKSIDLKICVWHISKEQLIFFPLVHFLHQVGHA